MAELCARYQRPWNAPRAKTFSLCAIKSGKLNWNKVGVTRREQDLSEAITEFEAIADACETVSVEGHTAYNMPWQTHIDLRNMVDVSRMVAASALERKEQRGAHFRLDYPEQNDAECLFNVTLTRGGDGRPALARQPVAFVHKSLEECQKYSKTPPKVSQ